MSNIEDIRRRVKLLIEGDLSFDHFCHIFLWLRQEFDRRLPTVREIGDFLAHPTRDQGISSDRFAVLMGQLFYQMDGPLDQYDLPLDFPEVARRRLKILSDRIFEMDPDLDPSTSSLLLKSIIKRFRKNDQTGTHLIPDEGSNDLERRLLLMLLARRFDFQPLDSATLHLEFRLGLIEGGLLDDGDDEALASVYEALIPFSLTIMHRCVVRVLNERYPSKKQEPDDQYTITYEDGSEETHFRYPLGIELLLGIRDVTLGIYSEFNKASTNSNRLLKLVLRWRNRELWV